MGEVDECGNFKVSGPHLDNFRIWCIDGHDFSGEEKADQAEQNTGSGNDLNQQIKHSADRNLVSGSPVLSC